MLLYVSGMTTKFVTRLRTITFNPSSRAARTSGMVLIPTTSAPISLRNRPSAGVSNVGPLTQAYVPSAKSDSSNRRSCAARKASRLRDGEYASDNGRKRGRSSEVCGPNKGFMPVMLGRAIWSRITTTTIFSKRTKFKWLMLTCSHWNTGIERSRSIGR